ncbi:GyrI-like domain-containing protein [Vibrio metschnikovii]|uniref:GyrI-like domain-containing protein n=1 Tax=Vibrio metschnikovii TaxID=28172 RepID=UPI00164C01F3|nr:GyrI-like domain-containing protein [Vibrio metschnikovii]MBC5830881.1 GyrI-like domain-containing protein [Vibrio metschnikovii]
MNLQKINALKVSGISVRTTNVHEMDLSTSKISYAWEKFNEDMYPLLSPVSKVYGLYTHYSSDFRGEFDVIACASNIDPTGLEHSVTSEIKSGVYLVFKRKGHMPQVVSDLWQEVWRYFSSVDCTHTRAYTTDFEYYKSNNEVEIFIAIK